MDKIVRKNVNSMFTWGGGISNTYVCLKDRIVVEVKSLRS